MSGIYFDVISGNKTARYTPEIAINLKNYKALAGIFTDFIDGDVWHDT